MLTRCVPRAHALPRISNSLLLGHLLLLACVFAAPPPRKLFSCSDSGICEPAGQASNGSALPVCLLTCGAGPLWPLPRHSSLTGTLSGFSRCSVDVAFATPTEAGVETLLKAAARHFMEALGAPKDVSRACPTTGSRLNVVFDVVSSDSLLQSSSDESYTLRINGGDAETDSTFANIRAPHFAGAMQALQTLGQLVAFDPAQGSHVIAHGIIEDAPAFPHRSILVDTARQFIPVPQLMKTVRAMAMNKMNVLHMHISDTASFPIELFGAASNLTMYGAYGPDEYYSAQQIRDLVQYAKEHAVRVVPEIDAPAHANQGWQWGVEAGLGELVLCTSGSWANKALEPPSGQMNIVNPELYRILAAVYTQISDLFQSDVFHLGGDEVLVGNDETWASCWNNTELGAPILRYLEDQGMDRADPESFYRLWGNFTRKAAAEVKDAYGKAGKTLSKMIQWGGAETAPSEITYNLMAQPNVEEIVPPAEFMIQVWDNVNGSIVPDLLRRGYEVILSHVDYTYLDCG